VYRLVGDGAKRAVLFAAVLVSSFSAGAAALHLKQIIAPPAAQRIQDSGFYSVIVRQQSRQLVQCSGALVFLGDSLTAGLATSNVAPNTENLGIPGDTIDGLLSRIGRYDLSQARGVVVEIGINNWPLDRFADFGSKYRQLLAALPSGIPITAVGIMPTNPKSVTVGFAQNGLKAAIINTNARIERACKDRRACTYIDLSKNLGDSQGELAAPYDAGDGVHISRAGYTIWGKALKVALGIS
jgi:lysophospholipase L1-like esterase